MDDIHRGKTPRTVVLREKVWRIELSRRKVRAYVLLHKKAFAAGAAFALAAGIYGYALTGLASSASFYPSSCLGNWQNVENVLGKPDLPPGAPESSFTPLNAATLATSSAQMFCGNFQGATGIAALENNTFEKATLVLSWYFAFPENAPPEASGTPATSTASSSAAGAASSTENASGTVPGGMQPSIAPSSSSPVAASSSAPATTTNASAATSTMMNATATPAAAAASGEGISEPAATSTATATVDAAPAPAPAPASATATTPTAAGTSSDATAPPPPAPPAPVPAPAPSSTDSTTTSATSFLWHWTPFLVAHAADGSASTSLEASTGTPPATGAPADGSTGTVATLSVDTADFASLTVPSSSAGDILTIEMSTDGATWTPVVNVNAANWRTGSYDLPIHSWEELKHLQVAFVGLPTADVFPAVYLDAVGVSVEYGGASPAAGDAAESASSSPAVPAVPGSGMAGNGTAGGAANGITPSVSRPALSREALDRVFSPAAAQSCAVAPFTGDVRPGGSTSFLLSLIPPLPPAPSGTIPADATGTATSGAERAATGAAAAAAALPTDHLFDAVLGSLPDGISGRIIPGTDGTDTIGIDAAPGTAPGSYAVIVVYKERQNDGTVLPNFCQFTIFVR